MIVDRREGDALQIDTLSWWNGQGRERVRMHNRNAAAIRRLDQPKFRCWSTAFFCSGDPVGRPLLICSQLQFFVSERRLGSVAQNTPTAMEKFIVLETIDNN